MRELSCWTHKDTTQQAVTHNNHDHFIPRILHKGIQTDYRGLFNHILLPQHHILVLVVEIQDVVVVFEK